MRLDVGKAAIEQRLRAVDRQRLDLVRRRAALIIAAARIAFGIFGGDDRSLRLQHRLRHDVFRLDQFDLKLLAVQFMLHRCRDRGIDGIDAIGEIAGRFDGFVEDVGGHRRVSGWGGLESLSTRRAWRSPAKSVVRKAARHALAMSMPVSRAPSAMTLASLCSRASFADKGSDTSAQRQAGLRLTAIEMPTPDPHSATPRCALPFATASARRYP